MRFTLLASSRTRRPYAISLILHGILIAVLASIRWTPVTVWKRWAPLVLVEPAVSAPRQVRTARPPVVPPRRPVLLPAAPRQSAPAVQAVVLPAPPPAAEPRISLPETTPATAPIAPPVALPHNAPPPAVRTGVFSAPLAPEPSPARPVGTVATGAFGSPVPGMAARVPDRSVATGAFQAPLLASPAAPTPSSATPAGFDAAAAQPAANRQAMSVAGPVGAFTAPAPAPAPSAPKPTIASSGFGDVSAESPGPGRPGAGHHDQFSSDIEILFKPRPDYTEEARRRRIEGEVLLEVLFAASGEIRVLRVVKGLGAGLDENAIRAASRIRFKPARENGRPVDRTAIARI